MAFALRMEGVARPGKFFDLRQGGATISASVILRCFCALCVNVTLSVRERVSVRVTCMLRARLCRKEASRSFYVT